ISNSALASTTVDGLVQGNYQFELTVTDNTGAVGKDIVNVTVNPAPNKPLTVNAGTDQTITLPTNSVNVSGNGVDSDGKIVSYYWMKISGPSSYSIVNQSSAYTEITGLQEGVYEFQLKVTDDNGSVASDTLQVTVVASAVPSNKPVNIAPTANAGSDITIVSPGNSVNLVGTGSDQDGTIKSYLWKQLSGPSFTSISNAGSSSTSVTGLIGGTYEYQLTVTDDQGAEGKDTVSVTVALARLAPQTGKLNIYPNPVHTVTTIEFTTLYANTNVGILVTNMSGMTVYKKDFVSNSIEVTQQIDMSNLVKGVYVVSVFFDGMKQQSTKVIRL
ncbi:MAG: T9SS type A sorting domain-containing protein, partial [Bacteroidota bacterium]|nr:T9SS type A sorting domain-containing protein [Bacteroidota bacterium]